jgi:hypothetical protein
MNTYIRERLRADASHLVARAAAEQPIVHSGLRGRFRELLVDTILAPWLPPYACCATGMIVDAWDRQREATQEDVVVFDRSIVPAVLAHATAMEGVFPLDGVLARVEVKSRLDQGEVKKAVKAAAEIYRMRFAGPPGRTYEAPLCALFAFRSDLSPNSDPADELQRLLDVVQACGLHRQGACAEIPGPISVLCVVGRGCRTFTQTDSRPRWVRAIRTADHDEILHFVGVLSNNCFMIHRDRQGVAGWESGPAGGGIGWFIFSDDTTEVSPLQEPSGS